MRWHRIQALVLRYTYLYTRSVPRVTEILFWPLMDLLVWGYVSVYLHRVGGVSGAANAFMFLLGAMIFWDILYRAQQGVTLSFLEDVWSRNLLNVFVAPVRVSEFVLTTFIVGFFRIAVTIGVLAGLAYALYSFNIFSLGMSLVPFFANLLLMGWALGMVTTSLIMRWGQGAEALAWGVPFLIQPVAAVFYPLDVLPGWLQPVALSIPATHVFEGMRQVLRGEGVSAASLAAAFALNAVYLVAAALFFRYMFTVARRKGLLAKLGTQ
ncbi:MAG: ABC transporter permease [Verrucomicrobia bacterium]|nr:ABC transporter permease [Verrucomicrobiota bacterium]